MRELTLAILSALFLLILTNCSSSTKHKDFTYTVTESLFLDTEQAEGVVEPLNPSTLVCPPVWNIEVGFIVDDGKWVKKGDTICLLESKPLIQGYEKNKEALERYIAEYNKTKANLELEYAMLEAQVKNNEAQTAISNLDSTRLEYVSKAEREIKKLKLKIANIEHKKYQKKIRSLETVNRSELRKAELHIMQCQNQIEKSERMLEMLVLTAPDSGFTIVGNSISVEDQKIQKGEQLYPGLKIVDISNNGASKVKMRVPETTFKRIKVGQRVDFTFDAMPGNRATGVITKKTPVGTPHKKNSHVKFFDVFASVDSSDTSVTAGLSANCNIIISSDSNVISIPNIALFDKDSMRVVYVKEHNKFTQRAVKTEKQSQSETVITEGLAVGDVILMRDIELQRK